MEPVTHALASLALGRAGLNKTTRLATPMLLASGLTADLDWLSRAGGPRAFLHGHRTVTHSLVGTVAIALALGGVFWLLGRKHPARPILLARAVIVCLVGAAAHLLLDLINSYGVKLLWPFRDKWYAWDLMDAVDPWVLLLLLLGLLLPGLFRLVTEEIGARPKARGAQRGAIIALALLVLYGGGRTMLHMRALEMLRSRVYRGETPLAVGAFPRSVSPLTWSGVVETDNMLEEIEVSLGPGGTFDPDLGRTHFKPEDSPVLEAARKAEIAVEFLKFARFPLASTEKIDKDYRVVLRDLRFASRLPSSPGFTAVIELNPQLLLIGEELRLDAAR